MPDIPPTGAKEISATFGVAVFSGETQPAVVLSVGGSCTNVTTPIGIENACGVGSVIVK